MPPTTIRITRPISSIQTDEITDQYETTITVDKNGTTIIDPETEADKQGIMDIINGTRSQVALGSNTD